MHVQALVVFVFIGFRDSFLDDAVLHELIAHVLAMAFWTRWHWTPPFPH